MTHAMNLYLIYFLSVISELRSVLTAIVLVYGVVMVVVFVSSIIYAVTEDELEYIIKIKDKLKLFLWVWVILALLLVFIPTKDVMMQIIPTKQIVLNNSDKNKTPKTLIKDYK